MDNHPKRLIALAFVLASLALAAPSIATAAPPGNDAFSAAVVVDPSALPFSASVAIGEATLEFGEPNCTGIGKSVWYRITPSANGVLKADVGGSSFFDPVVAVYRQAGSGLGGLSLLTCTSQFSNGSALFGATGGQTYYLQAGAINSFTTGTLSVAVQSIPPPPNDNFEAAQAVATLPYHTTVDLSGATRESDEPTPSCGSSVPGSAWWAFTPAATGSYAVASSSPFNTLAAFSGSSLGGLQEVACRNGGSLTFRATGGTTTYVEVAGGQVPGGGFIPFELTFDRTPDPVASFFYNPGFPSIFDTVQFYNSSFDPVNLGFQPETWDFGDGSASETGCCPSHRYVVDGTYHATLTVVTVDGRTAVAARDVEVRTHDVAIQNVSVPDSIRIGKTRTVAVGIGNSRYAETVQVQLMKSVAGGGWQQVGVLTQYVPVQKARLVVEFSFNYTASPDDAVIGKITFEAVATIEGAPDAIPADNTFISLPVKVKT